MNYNQGKNSKVILEKKTETYLFNHSTNKLKIETTNQRDQIVKIKIDYQVKKKNNFHV